MTRRLVQEFDPEQVILFGSYAWGKPTKDSDVDLMVIVTESDETEYQRMVRGLHALRDKIVPTDVFIKTRAEFDRYKEVYASLECLIAEQGIVLYDQRTQKGIRPKLAHQSAK
ncbi:MAG: nucleotidyltransferase domain-containing protein [Chloroflexota bacterium]|nr:MAG: nucleotidyltransferase domain-containing protein [Chloroflexota bacterium]